MIKYAYFKHIYTVFKYNKSLIYYYKMSSINL